MTDINEILRNNPISAVSLYSQIQADYLVQLGKRLSAKMDTYEGTIDDFTETYGQFWLWLLGAYEVIRTLCEYSDQFDPDFAEKLQELKRDLAKVRVPFAKQEYRGRSEGIGGDLSVTSFGKDMKFQIDGEEVSSQDVIAKVTNFIESIDLNQIDPNAS